MLPRQPTPIVRKPVGLLAGARAAYAIGDITIVHDPAAGLGAKCTVAQVDGLLASLADRGDVDIDADWYEAQSRRSGSNKGTGSSACRTWCSSR